MATPTRPILTAQCSSPQSEKQSSQLTCCPRLPSAQPLSTIGLAVFRKQQICLYLSKGSADHTGQEGPCLQAGRFGEEKLC